MLVKFEKPTPETIQFIADNMRDEDAAEVMAVGNMTPWQAIDISIKTSHFSTVGTVDGTPVAIFGLSVHNIVTGEGSPWMLCSRQALDHKRGFFTDTPQAVEAMLNICPKLSNYVHVNNKLSIRWLKWLGFTIEEPIPYGVNGELFHPFYMVR